jgi:agmatinase
MSGKPRPLGFLGAGTREGARWALVGAPLDATVSYRPGSRFGPPAVRAASWVLEEWSPAAGRGLEDVGLCDLGDLDLPPGDVPASLAAIGDTVEALASEGLRPFVLGGEHLVTLPAVAALAARHPGLRVLQFDAHADLRDEYLGLRLSHATVMRRISEVVGPERVYQLGIRSGTEAEWRFGRGATRMAMDALTLPAEWRQALESGPVYVTVDIDCVDPAFAPGTGTPEPGGPGAREFLAALDGLRGLRLVGADVVEVAPAYDPGAITAILAAKAVRQVLLCATGGDCGDGAPR